MSDNKKNKFTDNPVVKAIGTQRLIAMLALCVLFVFLRRITVLPSVQHLCKYYGCVLLYRIYGDRCYLRDHYREESIFPSERCLCVLP